MTELLGGIHKKLLGGNRWETNLLRDLLRLTEKLEKLNFFYDNCSSTWKLIFKDPQQWILFWLTFSTFRQQILHPRSIYIYNELNLPCFCRLFLDQFHIYNILTVSIFLILTHWLLIYNSTAGIPIVFHNHSHIKL